MSQLKPKLRRAPSLAELAEKQEAARRLVELDAWTEVPNNPPAEGIAATIVPAVVAPAVPKPKKPEPAVVLKPWEVPAETDNHPYHLICGERLFQKMDFIWKRKGYKSMRHWVLETLDKQADKALKELGEG